MKKILAVIALMVSHLAFGQTITGVDAYQDGNDIVIEYSISASYEVASGSRFSVVPSVSTDGGKNFAVLSSVSGDLDNISAGVGKRIVWKVLKDCRSFVHTNVVFKVDIARVTQVTSATQVRPAMQENPATQVVNSGQPQSGEEYYRKGQESEKAKKYAEAIKYYRIASQKGYKQADARIQQLQLKFW